MIYYVRRNTLPEIDPAKAQLSSCKRRASPAYTICCQFNRFALDEGRIACTAESCAVSARE